MSTFEVEVVAVPKLYKHPNADTLSTTTVNGFPCIVKTGDVLEGELAAYIPEDSVVPLNHPAFEFLRKHETDTQARVKAVRLRKVYSEGLLVPLRVLKVTAKKGDNVAEVFGIKKYEQPINTNTRIAMRAAREAKDPGTSPRYDVEHFGKYFVARPEGGEIVASEKIHGCVLPNAKITMADGSLRRMKDVQPGEFVLGLNESGQAVSSQVIQKFKNGKTNKWLRFRTTREGCGKGNPYATFSCTPNHKVFSDGQYVRADSLRVGSKVLVHYRKAELDIFQQEVLKGKLLGDGCFSGKSVRWVHSEKQTDYLAFTAKAIGGLAHPTVQNAVSGYGSEMRHMRTVNSDLVAEFASAFYVNGKKTVPSDIRLTPISLAFWYMDDGSLGCHPGQLDRANFAVCSFGKTECEALVRALAVLGVTNVTYFEADGYSRIRVNADSADFMFALIAPYVPESMQYKLPERFRGGKPFLPSVDFKPSVVEQTVTKIEHRYDDTMRHDMETETHNYFVGSVLVHNCNARYVYSKGQLHVGSHNVWRAKIKHIPFLLRVLNGLISIFTGSKHYSLKERFWKGMSRGSPTKTNKVDPWWKVAEDLALEAKLKEFENVTVYGEIYGHVQDLTYSVPETEVVRFAAFDVRGRDGQWMSYDDARKFCLDLGIEFVPEVYRGSVEGFGPHLASGKSLIDGKTLREGVVVRYVDSSTDRYRYKIVSPEYRLRKGETTEFH